MALNTAKHKTILIKILKDIYTHPHLGPILGFTGGTAAHLFYGLDRFSVDLDFDLLEINQADFVFNEIHQILAKYGRIKTADKKRFSLIFIMAYDDKDTGAQNVKVEINLRDFGSKFEVKSYLGISMKVMARDDMTANKLFAFYERIGKTNRDIYDAWFFFEHNWPVNHDLVERRMEMPFKIFLETCLDLLGKIDNKTILAGMGELLSESQKGWVRSKLKEELLFQIRLYIETHY